ncbi:unnamed protein product, partial [marine sediment metagenome]
PNDWAVLIIRKQPYVGEYYWTLISESKTRIRIPEGNYSWDFYIDGLTMCSGTALNDKIINVVPGIINYTIYLNPFFTNVTFHDLVISVFDNSSSIWKPINTNETGYVLCLDSWYLDHPYTGVSPWQVVGADPAVAGFFNEYVSLDEDGLTKYIHYLRPLGEYKASIRYQNYSGADYFDPTIFKLNSSNSGKAVLYGTPDSKPTLVFDNTEPEININEITISGEVKKLGSQYHAYGKITMEFAPTDNLGVQEINAKVNDNYFSAVKNATDTNKFSLEIDVLELEDG